MTTTTAPKIRDQKTGRMRKVTSLDETRIRFNWGFHDGTDCKVNDRPRVDGLTLATIRAKHYDPAYAEGWVAGYMEASESGVRSETSEPAWIETLRRCPVTLGQTYAAFRIAKKVRS